MRQKLNENPLLQVAVIGVLLVLAGVFVLSSMGGGGGEEETSTATAGAASVATPSGSATVAATVTSPTSAPPTSSAPPPSVPPLPAPPLPRPLLAAFAENRTVVLLIVKRAGIDDALTTAGALPLALKRDVALFTVPAAKIARYTAITQAVDVSRVPALVVVRPRRLDHGAVTASVSYGFQSPQSIAQAVIDASYEGRTLSYHP
jgi:hypothetical protein